MLSRSSGGWKPEAQVSPGPHSSWNLLERILPGFFSLPAVPDNPRVPRRVAASLQALPPSGGCRPCVSVSPPRGKTQVLWDEGHALLLWPCLHESIPRDPFPSRPHAEGLGRGLEKIFWERTIQFTQAAVLRESTSPPQALSSH